MKEFRISRPALFGSVALMTAAAVSACGGEQKPKSSDRPDGTPVATRTLGIDVTPGSVQATVEANSPVVEPTKVVQESLTQDQVPQAVDEVVGLINSGFSGISVEPSQLSTNQHAEPDTLAKYLDYCSRAGEVFTEPDGITVGPDHPNYWISVSGLCQEVAEATKELYALTGKAEFLKANQTMKRVHRFVFELAKVANPQEVTEEDWNLIVSIAYIGYQDPGLPK